MFAWTNLIKKKNSNSLLFKELYVISKVIVLSSMNGLGKRYHCTFYVKLFNSVFISLTPLLFLKKSFHIFAFLFFCNSSLSLSLTFYPFLYLFLYLTLWAPTIFAAFTFSNLSITWVPGICIVTVFKLSYLIWPSKYRVRLPII